MNTVKLLQDLIEELEAKLEEDKTLSEEDYYLRYGKDKAQGIANLKEEIGFNLALFQEAESAEAEEDDDRYDSMTAGAFANEESMRRFLL